MHHHDDHDHDHDHHPADCACEVCSAAKCGTCGHKHASSGKCDCGCG